MTAIAEEMGGDGAMKMTRDFCSGFTSAVAILGIEGDSRGANWSEAYEYLKKRLNNLEPLGEDLVERLRYRGGLCTEAADEIERIGALSKLPPAPDREAHKVMTAITEGMKLEAAQKYASLLGINYDKALSHDQHKFLLHAEKILTAALSKLPPAP